MPRIFLTVLGSLELFQRVKGMEQMCGGGSAFPCEPGATPYGPGLRGNCPWEMTSKKCFTRKLGKGVHRMWGKRASFREEEAATWRVFQASILKEQFRLYNGRPPDLLRGPKFWRQGHVSSFPFAILQRHS